MSNPGPASTTSSVYVGGGQPQVVGASSSAYVSFYGATATIQSTAISTVVSGTAATTATYGVLTPDVTALIAATNSIIAVLRSKGFIAS